MRSSSASSAAPQDDPRFERFAFDAVDVYALALLDASMTMHMFGEGVPGLKDWSGAEVDLLTRWLDEDSAEDSAERYLETD